MRPNTSPSSTFTAAKLIRRYPRVVWAVNKTSRISVDPSHSQRSRLRGVHPFDRQRATKITDDDDILVVLVAAPLPAYAADARVEELPTKYPPMKGNSTHSAERETAVGGLCIMGDKTQPQRLNGRKRSRHIEPRDRLHRATSRPFSAAQRRSASKVSPESRSAAAVTFGPDDLADRSQSCNTGA
jgi:hypothetical protein